MRLRALLLATLLAAPAAAQSVDPPIAIFEGGSTRARGSIIIHNPSLFPITWVLEPKRFLIACSGDVSFGPIDTTRTRLRLSAMSGRLGAKQRTTIFYDAQVDSVPSWFAIIVGFSPGRPQSGLSIRMEIPHIVYLMQREKVAETEVTITAATYRAASRTLLVSVANSSAKLTRITELVGVSTRGREFSIDACPLFPNSSRDFSYKWPDAEPPVKVIAKFAGFSLERQVDTAAASLPVTRPPGAPSCAPCLPF